MIRREFIISLIRVRPDFLVVVVSVVHSLVDYCLGLSLLAELVAQKAYDSDEDYGANCDSHDGTNRQA